MNSVPLHCSIGYGYVGDYPHRRCRSLIEGGRAGEGAPRLSPAQERPPPESDGIDLRHRDERAIANRPVPVQYPCMPAVIIAHRACPLHAPENSLEGIRKAAELGADGVEIDVQRTLDGVPVLMHDRTLWRTTGLYWPVRLLPFSLLRRLRLKDSAEQVPTLAEALQALPAELTAVIEIKHASATAATMAEVRRQGLESRVLLWSKHVSALRLTVDQAPEIESSLLRGNVWWAGGLRRLLNDAVRLGVGGISPHWRAITADFLAEAHRSKLKVFSMGHEVESMAEKLALGLDGIVTNRPEEARRALP